MDETYSSALYSATAHGHATAASAPDPATWALVILGFAVVGAMVRAWRAALTASAGSVAGRRGPAARR
jgi:hypothetical protein